MTDATIETESQESSKSKLGLLIGLVLACVGAGAGYFATSSGLFSSEDSKSDGIAAPSKDVAFIPVEQMTIAIGRPAEQRFLRFRAEIEVSVAYRDEIEKLMPRVVDVLNTYLRSVELRDLEDPSSLLTLRSQMRRRIDLVVGGGKVHDLLVMEFVVN